MSGEAQLAILTSFYAELSGNSAVMAIAEGVYDHVPQVDRPEDSSRFPYVLIGEILINENDTDTEIGFNAQATIHTWSRQEGRKEVLELQGAIFDALHRADISITGYHVSTCQQEYSNSFTDPDGLTRHGVQVFRVIFE